MISLLSHLVKKNSFLLKATGNSMLPVLRSNDVVQYRKINFKEAGINDIVLVRKNKRLFTHRIIYKTKQYLITKGDNSSVPDGKIAPKNVIAKAVSVKRSRQMIHIEQIYLFQSTLYFQEIVRIKTGFEKAGINFLFLKGLPLHLYIEKTHPQRLYLDCDVLIERKGFTKAESMLKNLGYQKVDSSLSKTQDRFNDTKTELSYYKILNGFPVVFDLHFEPVFMMTQLGRLDAFYPHQLINRLTDEILHSKKYVRIDGTSFPILNRRHLVSYLALHFFHHNLRGAFRLELIDKIVRKYHLSGDVWQQIALEIKYFRFQNFVYPVFVLLKKYYQTPVSRSFLSSIQPVNPLTRKFINRIIINTPIFDDEPRIAAGINRFMNLFFLSPSPFWKKPFIFFYPQVLYFIFWSLSRKIRSFFSLNHQLAH